ncbi:hypothetical protein RHMOL_Rhmol10G0180400 [Rhododendron molle]|uniref:Uncharacterized protein n=1 Tax=Rhododendron molle TaxID=49168 RepID=A0ACC0M4M8_RHOML|nr:hypothetical protein RHMOL_Rhmol10G0180400 [Rhododendron molle]
MADHGGNSGGGEVVNRPEDAGGPMETETEDQQPVGVVKEAEPRATEEARALEPSVEPVGSGTTAEGTPVVGGSSGDAGGSGAMGDDLGPIGSPPRDPTRGKGAVVAEEETTEIPYREEDVLFRPATTTATSSSHRPITKYDVVEHLPNKALAKLLEDNPIISEIVLKAKKDRARALAAAEAAEKVERERAEQEDLARDMEAKERAGVEAQWPRVTTVAEAGKLKRLDFSAEAYVPHMPHLFAPSGFAASVPQRTEYDDEVLLRDPEAHITNT